MVKVLLIYCQSFLANFILTCLTYDRLWAIEKPMDYRRRGKTQVARRAVLPLLVAALILTLPSPLVAEQREEGCIAGNPHLGNTRFPAVIGEVYTKGLMPLLRGVPFILILFWSARIARRLKNPRDRFGAPEREAATSLMMVCACFLLSQLAFSGSVITFQSFNGQTFYDKKMAAIFLLLAVSAVFTF